MELTENFHVENVSHFNLQPHRTYGRFVGIPVLQFFFTALSLDRQSVTKNCAIEASLKVIIREASIIVFEQFSSMAGDNK